MSVKHRAKLALGLAAIVVLGLAACTTGAPEPAAFKPAPALSDAGLGEGERLRVVASTSIVGDVVAQVGGDLIELQVLMQPGQDPHSYEPAARDIAGLEDAHVIFINGLGLEENLIEMLHGTGTQVPVVPLAEGIEPLAAEPLAAEHEEEDGDDHGDLDPHVWMNPLNVVTWTGTIADTLSTLDPRNAEGYAANAEAYAGELRALDEAIAAQAEAIPEAGRRLVTNHESLAYFAERYGFEVAGTVYLGASTLAEPNAGDLARLVETIRDTGMQAIFVDTSISDQQARIIAEEVGDEVGVYSLYTGALGPPGSGADSYLGMMRANIETIATALEPGA